MVKQNYFGEQNLSGISFQNFSNMQQTLCNNLSCFLTEEDFTGFTTLGDGFRCLIFKTRPFQFITAADNQAFDFVEKEIAFGSLKTNCIYIRPQIYVN